MFGRLQRPCPVVHTYHYAAPMHLGRLLARMSRLNGCWSSRPSRLRCVDDGQHRSASGSQPCRPGRTCGTCSDAARSETASLPTATCGKRLTSPLALAKLYSIASVLQTSYEGCCSEFMPSRTVLRGRSRPTALASRSSWCSPRRRLGSSTRQVRSVLPVIAFTPMRSMQHTQNLLKPCVVLMHGASGRGHVRSLFEACAHRHLQASQWHQARALRPAPAARSSMSSPLGRPCISVRTVGS